MVGRLDRLDGASTGAAPTALRVVRLRGIPTWPASPQAPTKEPVPLPAYATAGSSGLDLRAAVEQPVTLWPGETRRIPTGIAIEIPPGLEGRIRPRSGLSVEGIVATLGTIDSDYRGELSVLLFNSTKRAYSITPGDRIAQLVIAPVVRVAVVEVDDLSETARGTGGFGSTGTR